MQIHVLYRHFDLSRLKSTHEKIDVNRNNYFSMYSNIIFFLFCKATCSRLPKKTTRCPIKWHTYVHTHMCLYNQIFVTSNGKIKKNCFRKDLYTKKRIHTRVCVCVICYIYFASLFARTVWKKIKKGMSFSYFIIRHVLRKSSFSNLLKSVYIKHATQNETLMKRYITFVGEAKRLKRRRVFFFVFFKGIKEFYKKNEIIRCLHRTYRRSLSDSWWPVWFSLQWSHSKRWQTHSR